MRKVIKKILIYFSLLVLINRATAKEDSQACWDIGSLKEIGYSSEGSMSPDKKFYVNGEHDDSSFNLVNTETGQIESLPKPSGASVRFTSDGEIAISTIGAIDLSRPEGFKKAFDTAKTTLIDPKTKKSRAVSGYALADGVYKYSSQSTGILQLISDKGNIRRLNTAGGNDAPISVAYPTRQSHPDVVVDKKSKTAKILRGDKLIAEVKALDASKIDASNLQFSEDGNVLVAVANIPPNANGPVDSQMMVYNIKDKKSAVFNIEKNSITTRSNGAQLDNQGKWALLYSRQGGESSMVDLRTGSIRKFPHRMTNAFFDGGGKLVCGLSQEPTQLFKMFCVETATNKVASISDLPVQAGRIDPLSKGMYIITSYSQADGGSSVLWTNRKNCDPKSVTVDCDCNLSQDKATGIDVDKIKALALVPACSKKFSRGDWEKLVPKGNVLSEKDALLALKKFSKPGGFDSEKDLAILIGILDKGFDKENPAEMDAAMTGVLYSSTSLYSQLTTKYPHLLNISQKPNQDCLTAEEKKQISDAVFAYAKQRIKMNAGFDDIRKVAHIVKGTLNEEQREALADFGGDKMVERLGRYAEFEGFFPSKLYKFEYNKIKSIFDLPSKDLTDLTVVRDRAGQLNYYVLGESNFEGASGTDTELYYKKVKTISAKDVKEAQTEKFNWQYGGKSYSANVNLDPKEVNKSIIANDPSPNYKDLWKDNTLRGVVIAGSNLGSDLSDTVMQEYISYYTKEGFTFETPKDEKNLENYLKSKVNGPEPMQYFVKEAHSDGDEKNLFRINKEGKVLKGIKKVGDKTEIIELVYPTAGGDSKTTLISNKDFGQWVQEREKNKQSDLVYINSSCWSASKATYEISAAATKKLVNIPTTTSMTTFTGDDDNVMHALVDGIRKSKSYAEIRKDFEKSSDYKSKKQDVFLLPDEDEYKKRINEQVKNPISVDTQIYTQGASGQMTPYSIEETH